MDWAGVPSLQALRAFESAVRHGSLSAAARELNVTHPAIAQHVRKLESHFRCPLLLRDGQSMRPTPEGRSLAAALTDGFSTIAAAARDLEDRDAARPLRLSLTPSFAANWLMPRIGDFWARHPGIELELVPSPEMVDLRVQNFDLAVRYGRGPWPGVHSERLMAAGHAVVASPALVPGPVASLAELAHLEWFTEANNTEDLLWAEQCGLPVATVRLRSMPTITMVLEIIRTGHGVGILPRVIAESDIARGGLHVVLEEGRTALAYHLVTRQDRLSPHLRTLTRWLRRQAE